MKPATFAPWYAALYPQFAEIARKHGYALAVHGSLARDFDVVAIPWAEQVSPHREVIDDVLSQFAVTEIGQPETKNHGRVVYTLSIGFGDCFADWSFIMALNLSDREMAALNNLSTEQDISKTAVIRQALRIYQLVHERIKAGETMSFSGDKERIALFIGPEFGGGSHD